MDAEWQAGASRLTARAPLADIPEEEARYWAKKLEQLNAMRDQDEVSRDMAVGGRGDSALFLRLSLLSPPLSVAVSLSAGLPLYLCL